MADDAVVALTERGQREGVGGGPIEDKEYFRVGLLKELTDHVACLSGPIVGAVGREAPLIGFAQGGPGFRANPGRVIAGEMVLVTELGHGF